MTRVDVARMICRAIGVYVLLWALDAALYLPPHIMNFVHHVHDGSVLVGSSFWQQYYFVELVSALVRIVILVLVAKAFYRSGPWATRILMRGLEGTPPVQAEESMSTLR